MNSLIRNPKDFWTGIIYAVIGSGAIFIARDYGLGSATKMGPGYFPTFLGAALMLIGAISLTRSFLRPGEAVGGLAIKGLALILAATVLTGFLIRGAGLVVALPLLVVLSAYASTRFRWRAAVPIAIGMTVFCSLVFVKALGLPLPIVGPWLGG